MHIWLSPFQELKIRDHRPKHIPWYRFWGLEDRDNGILRRSSIRWQSKKSKVTFSKIFHLPSAFFKTQRVARMRRGPGANNERVRDYTTMVESRIRSIGCGQAISGDKRYLTCNYSPIYVSNGYPSYVSGPSCSKCSKRARCNDGLCSYKALRHTISIKGKITTESSNIDKQEVDDGQNKTGMYVDSLTMLYYSWQRLLISHINILVCRLKLPFADSLPFCVASLETWRFQHATGQSKDRLKVLT